MQRCRAVITATVVGSSALLGAVAAILPTGAHWLLWPGGVIVAIAEARIIMREIYRVTRRAEQRGAEDALTEVVRLGEGDPRWGRESRWRQAAD